MKYLKVRNQYLKGVEHKINCDSFKCNTCQKIDEKKSESDFNFNINKRWEV